MKVEIQIILMVVISIVLIVLGFPIGDMGFVIPAVPATYIGFIGVIVWMIMLLGTEWLRAASPQVITSIGHWSINHKDIHFIPVTEEEDGRTKIIDYLVMMFTGGIDRSGISTHGPPHYPIIMCRSVCVQKEGNSYHVDANLQFTSDNKLMPILREKKYLFHKRISSPNLFGMTSHADGSDTPKNLHLERTLKKAEEELDESEERIKRLYKGFRQEDQRKKPRFLTIGETKKIENMDLEEQ